MSFYCPTSSYPRVGGFRAKPVREGCQLQPFLPRIPLKSIEFRRSLDADKDSAVQKPVPVDSFPIQLNESLELDLYQKAPEGGGVFPLPHLWVVSSEERLDYFPLLGNCYCDADWDLPLYHFRHPLGFEYLKQFLWFSFTKEEIREHGLNVPSPSSMWERFEDRFMCSGIFYPVHKMRSLTFRGTGDVKYVRLHNFTPDPIRFRWLMPGGWKNRVGWLRQGEVVQEVEVPPHTTSREAEFSVRIDPEITDCKDHLQTLVVAQGPHRLEWFPLPLLPDREEGDFVLGMDEAFPFQGEPA